MDDAVSSRPDHLVVGPGSVVASKYRLERPLSHGSMGSVWVARHIALDSLVAIKFMVHTAMGGHSSASRQVESRTRFEREAKAAAQIRGANVVQILDYGVDRDTPYIVMELLRGEDLGARLKRLERLSLEEVSVIMSAVARALDAAHAAGLVHRDLKPANIFLSREGEDEIPKVLDFGVAKARRRDLASAEETLEGQLVGTLAYMSPEQTMASGDIDHRSDIWAMGVIAFRALTGMKPFPAEPIFEAITQIRNATPPLPTDLVPSLPPSVDTFFAQALERDIEKRFQSAKAFAKALRGVAGLKSTVPPSLESSPSDISQQVSRSRLSEPSRSMSLAGRAAISSSVIPGKPNAPRTSLYVAIAAIALVATFLVAVILARAPRAPADKPTVASPGHTGGPALPKTIEPPPPPPTVTPAPTTTLALTPVPAPSDSASLGASPVSDAHSAAPGQEGGVGHTPRTRPTDRTTPRPHGSGTPRPGDPDIGY